VLTTSSRHRLALGAAVRLQVQDHRFGFIKHLKKFSHVGPFVGYLRLLSRCHARAQPHERGCADGPGAQPGNPSVSGSSAESLPNAPRRPDSRSSLPRPARSASYPAATATARESISFSGTPAAAMSTTNCAQHLATGIDSHAGHVGSVALIATGESAGRVTNASFCLWRRSATRAGNSHFFGVHGEPSQLPPSW
jgi:hypothetical protein